MKRISDWVRNRKGGAKTSASAPYDIKEVMRRVDAQIGRAVEKLADR